MGCTLKKETLLKLINILVIGVGIYIFIKYIFGLIAPFVIAWLLASLLHPVVTFLTNKVKLSRGFATLVSMITVLTAFCTLIVFLIQQLYEQIVAYANAFPIYRKNIEDLFNAIETKLQALGTILPIPETFTTIEGISLEILNYITKWFCLIIEGLLHLCYASFI